MTGARPDLVASVRAPATSANLGPGFDALGLALALHDEVSARVTGGGLSVAVSGEGADVLPRDERHLVVRAMRATFAQLGMQPAGLAVECHNRIPQARGMGSSSAAIVAGVLLARALADDGPRRLDDDAVLRLASGLEGHPDNVAACLRGGATIAWDVALDVAGSAGAGGAGRAAGVRAVRFPPAASVRPVLFVPAQQGLTAAARAALPQTVPHGDAAHAVGRAALLVHALSSAPELLFDATEDRLHQPYRAAAAPVSARLLRDLRAAGVPAVISGAGPSVLALAAVPAGFPAGVPDVLRYDLQVDLAGAVVQTGRMM
jgi:homoserine kinase